MDVRVSAYVWLRVFVPGVFYWCGLYGWHNPIDAALCCYVIIVLVRRSTSVTQSATAAGAPTGFFPGEGHRWRKGSVVGGNHGECGARAYNGGLWHSPQRGPGAEPLVKGPGGEAPWSWKHFGHWMSNGAGTDSLNNNCICISTLGATVMIWEKSYVEIHGVRWPPLPLPGGAHELL